MSKRAKIYITLISLAIIVMVAIEVTKPNKVNWFQSYATHHKIPYGSIVFKQQLQRLAYKVTEVSQPPYEYLKQQNIKGTYLFYNNKVAFGEAELNSLLKWVKQGNTLMVFAQNFEDQLLDTLNLKTRYVYTLNNFNDQYQVALVNPNLKQNQNYKYDRPTAFYHFDKIDTTNTKVLGLLDKYHEDNSKKDTLINLIKQPFGKGSIVLSTFPQGLTNYFILKSPNQDYVAGLLGYFNHKQPIYLDTHYKSGKTFYTSPMYLLLNTPALKWAYYVILIGVLFYIIFEGKRKQRAIPIITPLKNQTLTFTRTIANMYYEKGKHKDIAEHKIEHFLEYIRQQHYLNTSEINTKFIKDLAARSNNTVEDTQKLFSFIETLQQKNNINNIELERLNTLIETFKANNQWKTKA